MSLSLISGKSAFLHDGYIVAIENCCAPMRICAHVRPCEDIVVRPCEDIYNKNSQVRNKSGYYWITDRPSNVYCGMNYTGLSCVDIYNNNRETDNKNGYYPINNNQWTVCNMTAIATGFFCSGQGEWR